MIVGEQANGEAVYNWVAIIWPVQTLSYYLFVSQIWCILTAIGNITLTVYVCVPRNMYGASTWRLARCCEEDKTNRQAWFWCLWVKRDLAFSINILQDKMFTCIAFFIVELKGISQYGEVEILCILQQDQGRTVYGTLLSSTGYYQTIGMGMTMKCAHCFISRTLYMVLCKCVYSFGLFY